MIQGDAHKVTVIGLYRQITFFIFWSSLPRFCVQPTSDKRPCRKYYANISGTLYGLRKMIRDISKAVCEEGRGVSPSSQCRAIDRATAA
jgi:hypothetical protein